MSKIEVNEVDKQTGSTLTIGGSGTTVQLGTGASQTGFGRTGTVNWQTTIKTGNFSVSDGEGYFVNTTSGAITASLPAGSAGAIVAFKDYLNTWDTNALTVSPNGSDKIGGANGDAVLNTESQSITLIFTDSVRGWVDIHDSTSDVVGKKFVTATGGSEATVCTNFKVHTFTGPGTFCVSCAGNAAGSNTVDYLVVGGGGSSAPFSSGGGGAGGFRESSGAASGSYSASPLGSGVSALSVTATGFPITVGAAGSPSPAANDAPNRSGSASSFSTISSAGGGGGGTGPNSQPTPTRAGGSGGSGGGGATADGPGANPGAGGSGNTPPVSPSQGNDGGGGRHVSGVQQAGGGGGGATAGGTNSTTPAGGAGGAGATTSISGTPTAYAGGGGGGIHSTGTGGAGGTGGGGTGASAGGGNPGMTGGTANRGGGAGGQGCGGGTSNGGSGIVIIRYRFQ